MGFGKIIKDAVIVERHINFVADFNESKEVKRMAVKNTLGDLNNHLFAQLEKLGDEDLNGELMDAEIRRAEAMAKIGEQIIKTGELQLKAMQHMDEYNYERTKTVPEMLEIRKGA